MIAEKIQKCIQRLPSSFQAEVLHFVEYLLAKAERRVPRREESVWSELSLASAMRGMEDEDGPTYSMSDLKVVF